MTSRSAFISHSSPDDRYVQEFVHLVRSLGYDDVFNDCHTIAPDELFWDRIKKGIHDCDAFVVILSQASVQSHWVNQEVEFARAQNKHVIPIRIDDCAIPQSFDGRDVIELRQGRSDKAKIAPSRILRHSPANLFGREEWLDALDAAWAANGRVHVYSLIAWGGTGKTSVVAHWVAKRMAAKDWPGVERYFDRSFYSQGARNDAQATADFFIADALEFFGDANPQAGSSWERGSRLARHVAEHRTLLILDGIEPLQFPPGSPQAGEFKDDALAALLQGLAMDNRGLCIVTSREPLKQLETFRGATAEEKQLNRLHKEAAIALLRHLQIIGTESELTAAWEDVDGHALTLQLLGRFLADAHGGDIRRRNEVHLTDADRDIPGRTAMKVLLTYETWLKSAGPNHQRDLAVLRLTGLFDRPATQDCLAVLRMAPEIPGLTDGIVSLTDVQWRLALKDLERLDLVTLSSTDDDELIIDTHPLVREYFAEALKREHGEAFRAAHARLFDHLCCITEHRPDSLAKLQPLYQAVHHGCLSGRHVDALEKVYLDRILRGREAAGFYSSRILGAIGANVSVIASFFDNPWARPSNALVESDQAWILNEAAFYLRALGRLTEAIEPVRVSLQMRIKQKVWRSAAIVASNLSELEVALGRLASAIQNGKLAIEYADRSCDSFQQLVARATVATAFFQAGEFIEAKEMFLEAESLQAADNSAYQILYSVRGFQYANLLLRSAERAAWRKILIKKRLEEGADCCGQRDGPNVPKEEQGNNPSNDWMNSWIDAKNRVTEVLQWRNLPPWNHAADSLLDLALDHLTLVCARLYHSVLTDSQEPDLSSNMEAALSELRSTNSLDHLPKALLTAACHAGSLREQPAEARRFLDEAELIAKRGPMPLYLADVHLHRARLFWDHKELAKAKSLIEKLDYGRRRDELADAIEAIGLLA